ncbi:MAG: UDP-glucose 4-epimerase GalE [Chloroflexi bacterium]|nr:MAG: UDP-glucose 4-epimerase GalE [Chloroflexota bacterium]
MKILVTGGAGYIGSIVAAELIRAGHDVTVYDSLVRGHRQAVHPAATFVQGDVGDKTTLERILREGAFEAVMHFAAFIEAGESMKRPERYFANNTANALTLLSTMIEQGIKRFVFSSTAAVYGDPEYTPIDEEHPLRPINAYGASKLMVEQMLTWFNRIHGLGYAALRYFNAAGAAPPFGEDHRPETHLIPIILEVAMGQRDHLELYGTDYPTRDGTCVRDYIHVIDLARAHVLALEALRPGEQRVYNLGNGRGFTNREVLETARRVTGRPIPVVEAPRRPGDPAILIASSDRIQQELGWMPEHPDLEDIIASAWAWRQEHPHGYSG